MVRDDGKSSAPNKGKALPNPTNQPNQPRLGGGEGTAAVLKKRRDLGEELVKLIGSQIPGVGSGDNGEGEGR